MQRLSLEQDFSDCRHDTAVQCAQQRGFARAVGSDDRNYLAGFGAQRNIHDRFARVVINGDVACFEHRCFLFRVQTPTFARAAESADAGNTSA